MDAQLLISAQTTAEQAGALYGSAALDLPRRGVNQVRGGMGGIAKTLADWITANGGDILYRQKVEKLEIRDGKAVGLTTRKGLRMGFDQLIANLTPWGLADLLDANASPGLNSEINNRSHGWGAFMLYLGVRADGLQDAPDHLQVVVDPEARLGEGNSVFLSASDREDLSRAPAGYRALTVSTHTAVDEWWRLFHTDPDGYAARKAAYTEKVLQAIERAIPGIRKAVDSDPAWHPGDL